MTEFVDVVIVGAGISGISAAWHLQDRCPDKSYADPGAPREPRRHLGPVQVPGHPLGLRHVHPRIPVQAVDVGEGHRRRPVDHVLPEGDGRRVRHRQAHPVRPEGGRRRLVRRRQPLDAARRAGRRGRRDQRARSCSPAAATTTTTRATRPSSPAPRTSRARSSTRSTGRRTWTTRARRSSSSAAAPPP